MSSCHVCTDHPGPCVGAQFQESPDVEQPPRGTVRPATVLRIPGRLPLLLRHTGLAEHTRKPDKPVHRLGVLLPTFRWRTGPLTDVWISLATRNTRTRTCTRSPRLSLVFKPAPFAATSALQLIQRHRNRSQGKAPL